MPLLIVFVTADKTVIDEIVAKQSALVPSDLRANNFAALKGQEVIITKFRVNVRSTVDDLISDIEPRTGDASAVIILTDGTLAGLVPRLGDVFSVNEFVAPTFGQHLGNVLSALIARSLRTFRHYFLRFDDQKYQRILRLPLRNFDAPEVAALRAACHDMINTDNFGRELDRLLARLRERQRPKKASKYPDLYLVDDKKKHFALGAEVHARAETACPPHDLICALGNQFRFGRAFDGTRHYNVSYDGETRMAADYYDCHSQTRSGNNATHLNMFSNDYF